MNLTAIALRAIPLNLLACHPANRTVTASSPALRSLADSLRELGQTTPILVRPLADAFQILAGHRRYAAAQIAGLETLEAKIVEADDRQALMILTVENLQREDLDPLAQAALVAELVEQGMTLEEIGAELGRSPAWAAKRARLTALHDAWRVGATNGTFAWATIGHLEMVARLPVAVQAELATDMAESYRDPESLDAFADLIAGRYLHQLELAPWDVADLAVSPTAGACKDCAKRSSCEGRLFEDANQSGDRCLDAVCWAKKLAAHTRRRAAELGEKHDRVAVLVNKHGAHATPAPSGLPAEAVQVDASMVEACKKKDAGAIAAVDVETGTTLWVRPKSWADKETKKALGVTAAATVAADGSPDPAAETAGPTAAEKRAAKRTAWRVDQAEIALGDAEPPPSLEETVALYLALRVQRKSPLEPSTWTEVADLSKMTRADLAQELWNDITGNLNGLARGIRPGSVPPTEAIESLETMATLLPKEQEAKALEEIPEPKGKKA